MEIPLHTPNRFNESYAHKDLMVALVKNNLPSNEVGVERDAKVSPRSPGRGSNWIHPGLEVVQTTACGLGVVTRHRIAKGTTVVVYGGIVLTEAEFEGLSYEMQNFPFQIADGLFLSPRDEKDIGVGERINHSCEPNLGFSGSINLVAVRDIAAGEEVTIDYATCVASNDDAFVMECGCGTPSCRGTITGHDWKREDIQARLLPYFQPFLQERVRDLQRGSQGSGLRRLTAVQNSDKVKPQTVLPRGTLVSRAMRQIREFVLASLRNEWMAIPICVIAGMPSTLATIGIMAIAAPALRYFDFAKSEAAFISTVSLVASVVGYITYLVAYYVGMLWKERRDWITEGRVIWTGLSRKLRIIKYDFLAHLPSDFLVMPLMGAAMGGFFFAGVSQGWSIFWAHTLADIAYAIKEPFFWHGAKKFVDWQDSREGARGA